MSATTNGVAVHDFASYLAGLSLSERASAIAQAKIKAADQTSDEVPGAARNGKFAPRSRRARSSPSPLSGSGRRSSRWGALSLLYGPEDDGKSSLTAMIAAMVTLGTLPGSLKGQPASVEIIAYEDDPAAVLAPRLMAAGADLERVFIHGDDAGDELLVLTDDVDAFGERLAERGSRLVIVDPLPDGLREGLKDNNGDVRKGLVPLHRMAQRLGVAVLGVTHPNKGATDVANKVMGWKAWRSVPSSILLSGRDADDLDGPTRVVAVSKTNYAAKTAAKVRVESVNVDGVDHPQPRAQIQGASRLRRGQMDSKPLRSTSRL